MAFPITVTRTLTTPASPAAVWRAFETVSRWPEVMPALASVTLEPLGPLAAGSLIHAHPASVMPAPPVTYRVVAAEPPHHLTLVNEHESYRAETDYRIVARGGETDVVVVSRLDAVGLSESIRFLLWRARIKPVLIDNVYKRTQGLLVLAEQLA